MALLLFRPAELQAQWCRGDISQADSDCVSAMWVNRGWLKKTWYEVFNDCSEYGKVHVWVYRSNASPQWHTIAGTKVRRTNRAGHHVQKVHCCTNGGGDLCNMSDITAANCFRRWNDSPARTGDATCTITNDDQVTVTDDKKCKVEDASCDDGDGDTATSSITVKFGDFDEVSNCSGSLKVGEC